MNKNEQKIFMLDVIEVKRKCSRNLILFGQSYSLDRLECHVAKSLVLKQQISTLVHMWHLSMAFARVDALQPSQQSFSNVWIYPGMSVCF